MSALPTSSPQLNSMQTAQGLPPAWHPFTTLGQSFKTTWREPLTLMPVVGVLLMTIALVILSLQVSRVSDRAEKAANHTASLISEIDRLKQIIAKMESDRR